MFLFEFVNTQSFRTEYCITTGNTSAAPGRYDVFNIRVTTGATLSNAEIELNKDGNYIYSCFEWPSSGDPDNINTSVLRKLETGLCHVTGTTASYPNTNTVYL